MSWITKPIGNWATAMAVGRRKEDKLLSPEAVERLVYEAESRGFPGIAPWIREARSQARFVRKSALDRLYFFLDHPTHYCEVARAVGRGDVLRTLGGTSYQSEKDAKARPRRQLQYFVLGQVPRGRWESSVLIIPLLKKFRSVHAHEPEKLAEVDAQLRALVELSTARNRAAVIAELGGNVLLEEADVLKPGERAIYVACDSVLLRYASLTEVLVLKIGDAAEVWGRVLQLNSNRAGRSGNLVVLRIYRAPSTHEVSDWDQFHKLLQDMGASSTRNDGPGLSTEFHWTTLAELDALADQANLKKVDVSAVGAPVIIGPASRRRTSQEWKCHS